MSDAPLTLQALAEHLGLTYRGEADTSITHLASLKSATSGALSFVVDEKWRDDLRACGASVVIATPKLADDCPCAVLVSEQPYYHYALSSQWFEAPLSTAEIHPSAEIAADARIGSNVSIGARAVIGAGVVIGDNGHIGAGCVIERESTLGERCVLFANVTVYADCHLGDDCRVQSGAVIGAEGFGNARHAGGWERIAQLGRVMVGNRVQIGANTTIDRGALDDTVIADGVVLDNQIQVAHNVHIGENTAIAGCVGIAGSTHIGKNCTVGGGAGILGHLILVDNVHVAGRTTVRSSIKSPGHYASGSPLEPVSSWRRNALRIKQLDALAKSVKRLSRG